MDYPKAYATLVVAISDAIDLLERCNSVRAIMILSNALEKCEDQYIDSFDEM